MWRFITRDFRVSKGKLFLNMLAFFGSFMIFALLGFGQLSLGLLAISVLFGAVWVVRVVNDHNAAAASKALRQQHQQRLNLTPVQPKNSANVHGLKLFDAPTSPPRDV